LGRPNGLLAPGPLSGALTRLLSSTISLAGGLTMSLYTSWKLSILAFTSIFPVIVVTQVCAARIARTHHARRTHRRSGHHHRRARTSKASVQAHLAG
jgi:hypothetical protein